jgi:hypothetical protein
MREVYPTPPAADFDLRTHSINEKVTFGLR